MRRADFHYELPTELIAQEPLLERSASRLLLLDGATGAVSDRRILDLPELLAPGDLLIFNDTHVIPARLYGTKPSGGQVEFLLERPLERHRALVHARASKAVRAGMRITTSGGVVEMVARQGELWIAELPTTALEFFEAHGHVPLPPYIARDPTAADRERYQSRFARKPGAVAAPTASLHFDDLLLSRIKSRGIGTELVTLHVGAGTFQPVRSESVGAHVMHAEFTEVGAGVCAAIAATRARRGRVIAVGTTVVRALETAVGNGGLAPFIGDTKLFIVPGFRFHVVDAMVTNFHLPESTLLMLASAFAGREHVLAAYRHAVAERYRFFSYGDAMFITPTAGARA
ncbi:MAG TPA: tRNA preQ1(34) S-adenosylmethionine ribosyltransferase-isomerase QueA [Steroidobacteraceae bacterium]|nr:tRNA preQ1(34) S-adenosylmethionine ribosyltransferase-isomerase QueA [Steroidobacteraceae bacterium]HRX88120.1 tRNA preQ1(34) S-adenosylmethionine ribosyltransferase-isomerase QueA [Steroidobacteraceae bacterium]